jgi:hypothetical protein
MIGLIGETPHTCSPASMTHVHTPFMGMLPGDLPGAVCTRHQLPAVALTSLSFYTWTLHSGLGMIPTHTLHLLAKVIHHFSCTTGAAVMVTE